MGLLHRCSQAANCTEGNKMRKSKTVFLVMFLIAAFSAYGQCGVFGAEIVTTSADSYIEEFLSDYLSLFTYIPFEFIDGVPVYYDPVSGEIMDGGSNYYVTLYFLYGLVNNDAPLIKLVYGQAESASNDFALFKLVDGYYIEVYRYSGSAQFYSDKNGRIVVCFPPGHTSFGGIYYLTILNDSVVSEVIVDDNFYNHITKQTENDLDEYLYANDLTTIPGLPDEPLTKIDSLTALEKRITASVTQTLRDSNRIP
jgi:hypothetical protein